MIKVLLIEDEPLAMERMHELLKKSGVSIEIVAACDSVNDAVASLKGGLNPELIITDVQLADGDCFDIFRECPPACPVIFTTAYNQYAIEAFKVNAADYLLKPVKQEELNHALNKVKQQIRPASPIDYVHLARTILAEEQRFNRRYFIRYGDQIRSIDVKDIAYFYTTNKAVFLVTFGDRTYPVDKTLDVLESELDPTKYFRINRQFIVHVKSIAKMIPASKSRIELELEPAYEDGEVVVSTEKSPQFKIWMGHS
ncbi:MAG: response regulator transcription factor [Flavobacteriales bacterium]|nr:response regulator transcription factor [Flavobacteriales bacterium]